MPKYFIPGPLMTVTGPKPIIPHVYDRVTDAQLNEWNTLDGCQAQRSADPSFLEVQSRDYLPDAPAWSDERPPPDWSFMGDLATGTDGRRYRWPTRKELAEWIAKQP